MRVAQIGNFEPPHSTENELLRAMTALGWSVSAAQENIPEAWGQIARHVADFDMVLWTRTASLAPHHDIQWAMLQAADDAGVPTVAYHLDRWWGLRREHEIRTEPFFRCRHVCTADGGHDTEWAQVGVNHHWTPPAISEFELGPGTPRDEYASDIAFVGSWDGYGHLEAWHRPKLVGWLADTYGERVRFWPQRGQPAVRGNDLRDLYASVKVVVGDSCILDPGEGYYWSDRVPETIGRGAMLLHPHTAGITTEFPVGLGTWPMGDWPRLAEMIGDVLATPGVWRDSTATDAVAHVREHHTYTVRMRQVAELVGLTP